MKRTAILLVSLLANVVLVAGYFMSRPARVAPAAINITPARASTAPTPRVARGDRAVRTSTTVLTNEFDWTSVESADYKAYIQNLRAIGCPEETIRDIIIADVNKLYGARMAALFPSTKDFKFWVTEDKNRSAQRDRDRQIRALEREKRQLLKNLLGIDVEDEMAKWNGRPDEDDFRYGFLSAEKQQQLKALQNKYRDLERGLFAEGNGSNPENRAKVNALRAQREAEMAQLLSPQEYAEYQMRNSSTARNMRESLGSFQPSEWEFRELFNARKSFDDQFRFAGEGSDETTRQQRRAAEQQLEQQIRSTLGEDRYAQYQRANDDRFREAYDFTQRANLPRETADTLYDLRRVAEEQRQRVMNDPNIPAEQRLVILRQLADETKATLNQTLGPAYDDYARRSGWPERLTRTGGGGTDRGPGEFRRDRRG